MRVKFEVKGGATVVYSVDILPPAGHVYCLRGELYHVDESFLTAPSDNHDAIVRMTTISVTEMKAPAEPERPRPYRVRFIMPGGRDGGTHDVRVVPVQGTGVRYNGGVYEAFGVIYSVENDDVDATVQLR